MRGLEVLLKARYKLLSKKSLFWISSGQGGKNFQIRRWTAWGVPSPLGPILCLNLEKCTDWAVSGAKNFFTS